MKVLAINSSPRKNSNTEAAIGIIFRELQKEKVETELVNIGVMQFYGCIACGSCHSTGFCALNAKEGRESGTAEGTAQIINKMREADGLIIGSPVYYAGINGTLKAFLDRAFYSSGTAFRFKPCASVVVARRAGTTAALEQINKYFQIAEMLITPTMYWSGVHGGAPGEAVRDLEGVQMMEQTGRNMAYLLKLKEAGGFVPPKRASERVRFNYVR